MNAVEKAVETSSGEGKISIVNFTGPWCTVCHRQDDILEDFVEKRPEVSLHKFDVEDHPELAEGYDVLALPTILVFTDSGEPAWRSSGETVDKEGLSQALEDSVPG